MMKNYDEISITKCVYLEEMVFILGFLVTIGPWKPVYSSQYHVIINYHVNVMFI